MNSVDIRHQVTGFLAEDIGSGDVTAQIIPSNQSAQATVISRQSAVVCGQSWFNEVFAQLSPDVVVEWLCEEGDDVLENQLLCRLHGPARALLSGERTALNLLQTLSATAGVARQYAQTVEGTGCTLLDTRKTIPGLRLAQKYAVQVGGCRNHRIGLFDAILIKENHIVAAGSIAKAVANARQISSVPIEVEVETLDELQQALDAGVERVLLDNFSLDDLRRAVQINQQRIELEASGNLTRADLRAVAETGVDFISIGALTKHIQAVDLSMRIQLID